jgi:hypothetical protein
VPGLAPTPFFSTCFNPTRLTGGICLADLVRSWARHHPAADVEHAVECIDDLLRAGADEDGLRVRVLGAGGCGFDPGTHGLTMPVWLDLVRSLLLGRPDALLPQEAWEPLSPWPGQRIGAVPALRHLLGAYFHQDWDADDHTFEAVVGRFMAAEGEDRAAGLVRDIDHLLSLGLGEERLRIIVLGRFGSYYDPRPDLPGGSTMAGWLRAVRGIVVSAITA